MKKWFFFNSYTVPISAAWAVGSCLAASLRGVDDHKNMIVGGIAAGCVVGAHSKYINFSLSAYATRFLFFRGFLLWIPYEHSVYDVGLHLVLRHPIGTRLVE